MLNPITTQSAALPLPGGASLIKKFGVELGDVRVDKSVAGGIKPTGTGGFELNIDTTFLHDKEVYAYTKGGDPLYRSVPDIDLMLGTTMRGKYSKDFRGNEEAFDRFCRAHGIDADVYAAYLHGPSKYRLSKAWTDANAASIGQADALSGIIIALMRRNPEFFLFPIMDVVPESDSTGANPRFLNKPIFTAASAAAALPHLSTISVGTVANATGLEQVIPRLTHGLTFDDMGVHIAGLHGNDPYAAYLKLAAKNIATLFGGEFYYGALSVANMVPAGLRTFLDQTNNEFAIGGAVATLDATTILALDQGIDALEDFSTDPNVILLMNMLMRRRISAVDRAARQYVNREGMNTLGLMTQYYDDKPIVLTANLGQAENINKTTFTGSTGTSIWGVLVGGEDGVNNINIAGMPAMQMKVEPVVGQPETTFTILCHRSQILHNPRAAFRVTGYS